MKMKATNILRQPSFLKGIARSFDLFGKLDEYKYSEDPDSELIEKDWRNIGQDLQEKINAYEQQPSYQTC